MSDAKKSEALSALVDALDSTFWSSWQGTASFSDELEQARQILKRDLLNKYAPDLLDALKDVVENAHQAAFEGWLLRTSPSGDVEQVQRAWKESADYEDFSDAWCASLDVIAKATGESK